LVQPVTPVLTVARRVALVALHQSLLVRLNIRQTVVAAAIMLAAARTEMVAELVTAQTATLILQALLGTMVARLVDSVGM
jgi:hypothetical protein